MKKYPEFENGDYVMHNQQIKPEISGKILYSFIHEQQQTRYYQLDRHTEPIHESKLSLIISKEDLQKEKQH